MRYLELEIKEKGKYETYRVWVKKIGKFLWVHWKGRTFIYNPFYLTHQKSSLTVKDKFFKNPLESKNDTKKPSSEKNIAKNQLFSFILSPIYGRVAKINVKKGDQIKKGDKVLILESMKMEYNITSNFSGKVSKIHVKELDIIKEGEKLIFVES